MSKGPWIAVCQVNNEYASYYGVAELIRGDAQMVSDLADLVKTARKKFPDIDSIACSDVKVTWYESLPWQDRDFSEGERAEMDDFETAISDGLWVTVPGRLLETDREVAAAKEVRSRYEQMHVTASDVYFTFYEKHGDSEFCSPWLSIETLTKHFSEV